MNTETLKKLGLTQEQIDAVMAENGKDIKAEQDKAEGIKTERDTLQAHLSEANKTIKSYKDMDIDAIKQSAADWEQKAKEGKQELEQVRNGYALDKALSASGTLDVDLLKKALDLDHLKFKDDGVIGLDEQLKVLRESKPYLFQVEDTEPPTPEGFKSFVPEASSTPGGAESTMATEINAIFNQ